MYRPVVSATLWNKTMGRHATQHLQKQSGNPFVVWDRFSSLRLVPDIPGTRFSCTSTNLNQMTPIPTPPVPPTLWVRNMHGRSALLRDNWNRWAIDSKNTYPTNSSSCFLQRYVTKRWESKHSNSPNTIKQNIGWWNSSFISSYRIRPEDKTL